MTLSTDLARPFVIGSTPSALVDWANTAAAQLPLQRLVLLAAVLLSVGVLLQSSQSATRLTAPLSARFVAGVPWGTFVVVGLLLAVYFGIQGGIKEPTDPVVLPFRAWSYFDPVGMLLAGFAHANYSHLTGNVIGTLAFGSLAEYWWGHVVDRRTETVWQTIWTHPIARAVLIFPAVAILVGIVGTLVAVGPIIGFSTVVFAFAGFTLVRYPLVTVVVSVGQGVLGRLFDAIRQPQQVAVAEASYSTPWWADIALQGHTVGLLLGVLVGLAVLQLREESPPPAVHVWTGVLLFAVSRSLWAVYWFRGNETYVLYRAFGLALVFGLVAIVTYSIVAREEPVFPERAVPDPQGLVDGFASITRREVGLLVIVCSTALVIGPAIPVNLMTADDASLPGEPIEIEGYEITYGERVPNGQLSVLSVDAFGETTQLNTSGVIVRNTDRHIWSTETTTGELASEGASTVRIGGVGWSDSVTVNRTGWETVGGQTAYQVDLAHADERRTIFASGQATAEPIVAGYQLSINATDDAFYITADPVERAENTSDPTNGTDTSDSPTTTNTSDSATTTNTSDSATTTNTSDSPTTTNTSENDTTSDGTGSGDRIVLTDVPNNSSTVGPVAVPARGETVTLGPLRVVNRDDRLFAVSQGTAVRIAHKT